MTFRWQTMGATVRGVSHLSRDLPNQDVWGSVASNSASCVAVADGHGGRVHFRSARGAQIAVEETLAELSRLQDCGVPADADIQQVGRRVTERWNGRVRGDLESNPFHIEELELLAEEGRPSWPGVRKWPTGPLFWLPRLWIAYLQLGDGDILAVDEGGTTRRPLPGDPALAGNRTTLLCAEDAWEDMRVRVETEMPALIALSTDGYANSFQTDADFLQIGLLKNGAVRAGATCREAARNFRRGHPARKQRRHHVGAVAANRDRKRWHGADVERDSGRRGSSGRFPRRICELFDD